MHQFTYVPADSWAWLQSLPQLGGGKQSRWKRYTEKSWWPQQKRCTGLSGKPLGRPLGTLFWGANSVWWLGFDLPESQEMSSLPSDWGTAQKAVWQMSVHQKPAPESVAVLLSVHWQDLPTFQSPRHYVSRRELDTWAGSLQPPVGASHIGREPKKCIYDIGYLVEITSRLLCPAKDQPFRVLK